MNCFNPPLIVLAPPVDNFVPLISLSFDPPASTHINTPPLLEPPLPTNNGFVNHHPMTTRLKTSNFKLANINTIFGFHPKVPTSVHKAPSFPSWFQAMKDEYTTLLVSHTWSLTHLPIVCNWIFKNKFHEDGSFKRHKARLVAKGFTQTTGCDYNETYSPVVLGPSTKLTSITCF